MDDYENKSEAELGRLVKQAMKDNGFKKREVKKSQSGLAKFLDALGLTTIATAIVSLAASAWHAVRAAIFGF